MLVRTVFALSLGLLPGGLFAQAAPVAPPAQTAPTAPAAGANRQDRASRPLRIACIGDSTTFGAGIENREVQSYPAQLQHSLDETFGSGTRIVTNFGVNGSTALPGEHNWADQQFAAVAGFAPDVAIVSLGTNDTKPRHVGQPGADFGAALRELVARLRALPSAPQVILCQPVPIVRTMGQDDNTISDAVMAAQIRPAVSAVAAALACPVIDLEAALPDPQLLPDGVHPNAAAAQRMAVAVEDALLQSLQPAPETLAQRLSACGVAVKSSPHHTVAGARVLDFSLDGAAAKLVEPAQPAVGLPWAWRGYFWAHAPAFENALLAEGWSVAWIDTTDLFGNDEALRRWDNLYALSQRLGLSPRPFVFGVSRGGLPALRWAERHPAKVCGLYLDNAVLDIRSWPGGLGGGTGSAGDWTKAMACYDLNPQTAKDFADGPLSHLAGLAQARVPIFLLLNLADDVVPPAENGAILEARYQELGGPIQVQRREGLGHHPHGLEDPAPIVEFARQVGQPAWD